MGVPNILFLVLVAQTGRFVGFGGETKSKEESLTGTIRSRESVPPWRKIYLSMAQGALTDLKWVKWCLHSRPTESCFARTRRNVLVFVQRLVTVQGGIKNFTALESHPYFD